MELFEKSRHTLKANQPDDAVYMTLLSTGGSQNDVYAINEVLEGIGVPPIGGSDPEIEKTK